MELQQGVKAKPLAGQRTTIGYNLVNCTIPNLVPGGADSLRTCLRRKGKGKLTESLHSPPKENLPVDTTQGKILLVGTISFMASTNDKICCFFVCGN